MKITQAMILALLQVQENYHQIFMESYQKDQAEIISIVLLKIEMEDIQYEMMTLTTIGLLDPVLAVDDLQSPQQKKVTVGVGEILNMK